MSAKPRATLTLGLAVASLAAPATTLAAEPVQEMDWTCNMNRNGEWQCDISDEAAAAAAEPPSTVSSSPTPDADEPAPPQTETPRRPEPVTAPTTRTPPTAVSAPDPVVSSATASPSTTETAAATAPVLTPRAPRQGEWECGDNGSGEWDCEQGADGVGPSPAPSGSNSVTETAHTSHDNRWRHLDWVTTPAGSGLCRGYYLQPDFVTGEARSNAGDPTSVLMEAATSSTQLGGLSQLEGGVNIRQGDRLLSAAYAEYDQVTSKATLRGNVTFREPGILLLGDTAQADINTRETLFTDAQYVFHEQRLRGEANRLFHLQDGRLRMEDSDYTFCPPGDETWKLAADEIMLDREKGLGEAQDAVLRVGDVPVLYAPWFTFPLDDRRRSGFLYPSFSISSDSGFEVATPYYFNLAPNYDDTLTPRLMTNRGLLVENEFRYMNSYSSNVLSTAYLPDDSERGDSRWLLGVDSIVSMDNNRWRGEIDFTRVSDDDYFDDLSTDLEVRNEDHLNQRADITYQGNDFLAIARVHSYQTINDDLSPYRRLPQLWLQGGYNLSGMRFEYQTEYTDFDRDLDGLTGANRVIGERYYLMPSVSYNYRRPWGYITPAARLWTSSYSLKNQLSGLDDTPGTTAPILSLDSGLFFDRQMANGGTQTLEPRLFALYVEDEEQDSIPTFDTSLLDFDYRSLFRYNRFAGRDRIGDTQQISLGLTSRWIEDDGSEQARFSIGQAYYFADRNVQLNGAAPETSGSSDIATEAVWYFNRNWRTRLDMIFNDQFDIGESNVQLRYKDGVDRRFNFSYRFEDSIREQIDTSAIWPISTHWSVIGRWQQDLLNSENLETLVGVEYESCCWRVRMAARSWLDDTDNTDNAFFLQFFLKGLGGIGSGGGSYMNEIIGYQEREEQKK